jgi:hypothetical protein
MIVGSELVGSGTTADSPFERTFDPLATVPQRQWSKTSRCGTGPPVDQRHVPVAHHLPAELPEGRPEVPHPRRTQLRITPFSHPAGGGLSAAPGPRSFLGGYGAVGSG